jgi:acyl carrier protein
MTIRDQVVSILSRLFFSGNALDIRDDESLMKSGRVDSLGMMELVSEVGKKFNLEVDIDDLLPENFDSVDALTRFVESRK